MRTPKLSCLVPRNSSRSLVEPDALWIMGLIVRGSQGVVGLMQTKIRSASEPSSFAVLFSAYRHLSNSAWRRDRRDSVQLHGSAFAFSSQRLRSFWSAPRIETPGNPWSPRLINGLVVQIWQVWLAENYRTSTLRMLIKECRSSPLLTIFFLA